MEFVLFFWIAALAMLARNDEWACFAKETALCNASLKDSLAMTIDFWIATTCLTANLVMTRKVGRLPT